MPSFLIGSSLFLPVTMTTIKTWMSLNFGRISPLTAELAALECLEKMPYSFLALSSAFILDWNFFILAGNKDNYMFMVSDTFKIGPDSTMECI